MGSKVFAGIVLYNPEVQLLVQELNSLQKMNLSVILVDNSSANRDDLHTIVARFSSIIVEIIWNVSNMGIAKAHNQILERCSQHGANWVITFDQDSVIPENLLSEYCKHVNDNIGIISPVINYQNVKKKEAVQLPIFYEKNWVIASASMINVKVWEKVGGFDEQMFIDLVDRDFCIRVRNAGYKIIAIRNVILEHNLGSPVVKKILFHEFRTTNHNEIRKYYKVRNYIYLVRKKEVAFGDALLHIFQIMTETLFLEEKKLKKMKSIICGIRDGFLMRIM